jgi:thiamine-phosphate pyrophosphorylase
MEKLQFISHQNSQFTHLEVIQKACESGVKWVQLRIKNTSLSEILPIAVEAKRICDQHKAKLIINDHAMIAREIGAYGLHVGKEDMPVVEARKIVATNCLIGGTANTLEDILIHYNSGADYVGVGPFRFTTTKEKLSPVLGVKGYEIIMNELKRRNISIPVIAIGGIMVEDIKEIMQTGVYGIAVSSLLTNSNNMKNTVSSVLKTLNESNTIATC